MVHLLVAVDDSAREVQATEIILDREESHGKGVDQKIVVA
jgi:hypothetical protein